MLRLPRRLYDEVIVHCHREYPKEASGILVGRDGAVEQVFAMTNVDKSPISYTFDPLEHLRVEKEIRKTGLQFLAIYHSHTATQAIPSPVDVARASEPGVELLMPDVDYVLVSLQHRASPVMKNYTIRQRQILQDDLQLIE